MVEIDSLPIELDVPSREELREAHLRAQKRYNPEIDTARGTEPYIKAIVASDDKLVLLAHARKVGLSSLVSTAQGEAVSTWGRIEGVPRGEARGALGYVRIATATGGTTIFDGDVLVVRNDQGGPRFRCRHTAHYPNGGHVPIAAIDTGRETNLRAGTVMEWSSPRPGCNPICIVTEQEDGKGLVGGQSRPTLEQWKQSIIQKKQDPPGAANDAHVRMEAQRTPGVPVEAVFSYPGIRGPGIKSLVFTVPPSQFGGSRIPTSDQINLVRSHVENHFGADDGLMVGVILETPVSVVGHVSFRSGGANWADANPWPRYVSAAQKIVVSTQNTALSFSLGTANGVYTDVPAPTVGQTVCFFDRENIRFARKRIRTVSGTGPWAITVETANNASDESHVPGIGKLASPHSDALDDIGRRITEYFATLGPGEQVERFPPAGARRRREPLAQVRWPSSTTSADLERALKSDAVLDRDILEGQGESPATGSPGMISRMLTLGDIAIYEKATNQ